MGQGQDDPGPGTPPPPGLPRDVAQYVSSSYPHNHSYHLRAGRIMPHRQLRKRSDAIAALYPRPITSLLDPSCCKGYLVFDADARPGCTRALGIDVFAHDVKVCRAVARATSASNVRFECLAQVAASGRAADSYSTERILDAASRRFTVFPVSSLGRYPLWLLVKG